MKLGWKQTNWKCWNQKKTQMKIKTTKLLRRNDMKTKSAERKHKLKQTKFKIK